RRIFFSLLIFFLCIQYKYSKISPLMVFTGFMLFCDSLVFILLVVCFCYIKFMLYVFQSYSTVDISVVIRNKVFPFHWMCIRMVPTMMVVTQTCMAQSLILAQPIEHV